MTMVNGLVKQGSSAESEDKVSTLVKVPESKTPGMTQSGMAAAVKIESRDESKDGSEESDEDDNTPDSQATLSQTLSQTDETIRRLEKEGELNQVVGSQSILSQELICSSQRSDADEEGDVGFQLSQTTETSSAMARRLGLLSQETKDVSRPSSPIPTIASRQAPVPGTAESSGNVPAPVSDCSAVKTPPPRAAKAATISDTPFRESECFGSLLEAVEKITREEEMNAKMIAWQHSTGSVSEEDDSTSHNPQEGSRSRKTKRKLQMTGSPGSSPKKSRKSTATRKKESEQKKFQEIAKRAAALAEQTITDPEMAKKLLLSMALVRENPRSVPSVLPPRGAVVPEGFFWAHYPPLEAVLKKHMAQYYDLSTTKCQSAQQQTFNNDLVVHVRAVADKRGWEFHDTFTDKGLRDRIRCYYKTHIQNAKKRLRTMVRNPTKRANARHLCAHLDLIEKHGTDHLDGSSFGSDDDKDDHEQQAQFDDAEESAANAKRIEHGPVVPMLRGTAAAVTAVGV